MRRVSPAAAALWATLLVYLAAALSQFARAPYTAYFDTNEYRALARLPLGSAQLWLGPRPPGYPLLLALLPEDWLLRLQLALHLFAFVAIAWCIARQCRHAVVRAAAFATVLAVSLASGIFYWTRAVSTELLSTSLVVL